MNRYLWSQRPLAVSAIALFCLLLSPPSYSADGDTKNNPSKILVIYHTRTGNTEVMAKEIARHMKADILRIEADAYPVGFWGQLKASYDAWFHEPAVIKPEKADMSKCRLVFLGSPIWWFRPTPPLWMFVEKNDFTGKKVVLFNTFNSRFKQENIDEFAKEIEKKGGALINHIYVRRGRVYNQKTSEEVLAEVKKILSEGEGKWRKVIGEAGVKVNSSP